MPAKSGTMKVQGAKEAARVLKKLPTEVRRKVLRAAARKPATILKKAVIARAPSGPEIERTGPRASYGKLKEEIRVFRASRMSGRTRESVIVDIGRAFWGKFLERGTSKMTPKPFMVPAFEASVTEMVRAMRDTLGKGIEREAKKLAGPLGSTLKKRRRRR